MKFWHILVGYFLCVLMLSFWTSRNLDFWLTYTKGVQTESPFWLDFLISWLGPGAIMLNLISEVIRLFL